MNKEIESNNPKTAFTLAEIFSIHFAGCKKAASRIIRLVGGVTSASTLRVGSLRDTAPYRKCGFTLAEVLITLGIIGIVAAITLPTLISNHNKKVVETRLKHFSSTWQQVVNMQTALGSEFSISSLPANNPDAMLAFFDNYYKPYLQVSEVIKMDKGIIFSLSNGSGAYLRKTNECGAITACTYLFVCPRFKHCKSIDETIMTEAEYLSSDAGKNIFTFWLSGKPDTFYLSLGWSREYLKQRTKLFPATYCTSLIYMDGWKISDDNPCWNK